MAVRSYVLYLAHIGLWERTGLGMKMVSREGGFWHEWKGTKGRIGHSEVLALPWSCIADEVFSWVNVNLGSCHLAWVTAGAFGLQHVDGHFISGLEGGIRAV